MDGEQAEALLTAPVDWRLEPRLVAARAVV